MSDALSTLFTTRPKPELLPLILKYASSPLSFSPQPFTFCCTSYAHRRQARQPHIQRLPAIQHTERRARAIYPSE